MCDEWHLPVVAEPIPLFGQSGDDRYNAVDKMILKHVDVLPHGLINNVDEKLGRQGEKLRAYVEWLAKRIVELRTEDTYNPSLHIDVYGTIGLIFDKIRFAAQSTSQVCRSRPVIWNCTSKVRLTQVTNQTRSA